MGTRVQATPFSGTSWTNLAEALGAVLAGLGFLVRWVIAPATRNYIREDLKPQLDSAQKVPDLERRVDRIEGVIETMPAQLSRIEGYLAGKKE